MQPIPGEAKAPVVAHLVELGPDTAGIALGAPFRRPPGSQDVGSPGSAVGTGW
jgi:hypothetical protein